MFEVKLTLISKSECLVGIFIDQGEVQTKSDKKWIPFTRVRLGLLFITLDFMWLSL